MVHNYLRGDGLDQHFGRLDWIGYPSVTSVVAYRYLTDREGSTREVEGQTQTIVSKIGYDAFGNVASSSTGLDTASRYLYTGREFDRDTGLLYNRASSRNQRRKGYASSMLSPICPQNGGGQSKRTYAYST